MVTLAAFTFGLVVWIVIWGTGGSSFDGFLLTIAITLPAAAYQIFAPGIKKMLGAGEPPSSAS
jgi:hypothetical protein